MRVTRVSTPLLGVPRCCDCGEPFIIGHSCSKMTVGTEGQMLRELGTFQAAELARLTAELSALQTLHDAGTAPYTAEIERLQARNAELTAEVERLTASNERIQTLHEGLMKDAEKRYEQMYAEALAASKELERLREWLNTNTMFYNVDHAELSADGVNVPVLASVSKRIWYHATDDQDSFPFSAVVDAAIKEAGNG